MKRDWSLITLLLIVLNKAAFPQTVLTLQPDGITGKDAVVSNVTGETNINYGNNPEFMSQSYPYKRTLFQFDLSSIPSNATVISAFLSLYAYDLPGTGQHQLAPYSHIYIFPLSQAWDENTVNWDNQPGFYYSNYVTLPVADAVNQDYLDIDVRNLVQESVSFPASYFGYMLFQGNGGRLIFGSSDNANPALRPKLVITYAVCGGPPPTATVSPLNPSPICEGNSVTLTANSGSGYTYQLYNGSNFISGGSSPSFDVTASGNYYIKVTNPQGCTDNSPTSAVTVLLENAGITANTYYTGNGCTNGGMTLSATVAAGNNYQWMRDGLNITGANSDTYITSFAGNYSCLLTNGVCSKTSNTISAQAQVATIHVNGPTVFCTAGSTQLYVTINISSGQEMYQWQLDGVDIPGANTFYYVPVTSGSYHCVVTSSPFCNASATSGSMFIYAGVVPQIGIVSSVTGNPVNLCGGQTTDLTLVDLSTGLMWPDTGITWFRNFDPVPWPDGIYPVLYNVNETGNYIAIVSTVCGTSYSDHVEIHSANANAIPPEVYPGPGNVSGCGSVYLSTDYNLPWVNYQWRKDGVSIPGANNYDYSASQNGAYTCMFYNGCDSILSYPSNVTILNGSAVITAAVNTICSGQNRLLSANTNAGISSYQWQLNGSSIPGATSSTYSATMAGDYTCTESGTCGSFLSNIITLTEIPSPVAMVDCPGLAYSCTQGSIDLTATPGIGFTYSWYQNGIQLAGQNQQVLTVNQNGTYFAQVTAPNGCSNNSQPSRILFGAPSVTITSIDPATVCSGYYMHLTANPDGSANSYQWKVNGVDIPGAVSLSYIFNISQTATYTVEVTNECGATVSQGYTITVNPLPGNVASATGPVEFCSPGSVILDNGGGAGQSFQWYLNGLGMPISGATSPTYTASSSGNYFCVVTNIATACSSSTNMIRVSSSGLVATINSTTSPYSSCTSFQFMANGGAGYTYQWRRNGTNLGGATNQTYSATTTGSYDVVITGVCGSNISNSSYIRIDTAPINQAGTIIYPGATVSCADMPISFGINRFVLPPYVYNDLIQWKVDGIPIGGNTQTLTTALTGSYTVSLTNACGVVTSAPVAIVINPLPVVVISAPGGTTYCAGGTTSLEATTGSGYTYQWKRNGFDIPGANGSTYSAGETGTFTCLVMSADNCTVLSNFINVVEGPSIPLVSPSGSVSYCSGSSVTLSTGASVGNSYQWFLDGIIIAGAMGSNYDAASPGNYIVEVTNSCGINTSAATTVSQFPLTVASISPSGPTTFCAGGSVLLSAVHNQGNSYQWKKYGNIISGATNPDLLVNKNGKYKVMVTDSNSCVRGSNAIVVTVNPLPPASITANGPTTFCAGDSVELIANSGVGLTYQWKRYANLLPGQTNQTYVATTDGRYKCIVTNSFGCNRASNPIFITVPCYAEDNVKAALTYGNVSVYPNPSHGVTYIHHDGIRHETDEVNVFDLTGERMDFIQSVLDDDTIELSGLASGVYFIEIRKDGFSEIQKLIIL